MNEYQIRPVLSLGSAVIEAPYDECNAYTIIRNGEPVYVFEADANFDLQQKREQAERILHWLRTKESENENH